MYMCLVDPFIFKWEQVQQHHFIPKFSKRIRYCIVAFFLALSHSKFLLLLLGTYGEVYDEPAWKFMYGIAEAKERSGCEDNPMKQRYCDKRVLLNNWLEEQRDREFIKYDNSPKLSQVAPTWIVIAKYSELVMGLFTIPNVTFHTVWTHVPNRVLPCIHQAIVQQSSGYSLENSK